MTPLAKLLPCPFCGGEADMWPPTAKKSDPIANAGRFYPVVRCSKCWAEVGGEDHDASCKSAIERWNRRAALSGAELGGVEDDELEEMIADLRDISKEHGWLVCGAAAALLEQLSTPRAAEARRVSVADIGLCNWAAQILSDPERFNTRANDASAAIRRLVAALTPPSAEGEYRDAAGRLRSADGDAAIEDMETGGGPLL